MRNNRGQMTIFIIIALLIVAGIGIYYAVKGGFGISSIPAEFQPVYDFYDGCIAEEARAGVDLAGSQGGKIFLDEYSAGSDFAPTGNQLNFLGFPVPYWYYISGNGLIKEQVPTKSEIEEEIAEFIKERINDCDFENFYENGFWVELGEPEVSVDISDEKITISADSNVVVTREDDSARKTSHKVEIDSKIGKFYKIARDVYDAEKESAFLEDYAVDVLYSYAPVDGVEISCSGTVWKTREVVDDIKGGLEANMMSLKLKGDYYNIVEEEREYFVVDSVSTDESVNFIYSGTWPSKIEIADADDELMVAEPLGNSEGLGAMGFCYTPYHFVYDVSFPVMVQIYNNEEIFQFPVVVIIDNNVPREAVFSELNEEEVPDLCKYNTQDISISLYDTNLNSVDGKISYNCFNQECALGETEDGKFEGKAPGCVNGYLIVNADGYAKKKQLFSSNEEKNVNLILDREYEIDVSLEVGGSNLDGTAIVSFAKEDGGKIISASLPGFDSVKLSEGQYEVRVYVYGDSEIKIPESTKTQCTEVPKGGIFGVFGVTEEQCFEITIPEIVLGSALIGGGKTNHYLLESELENRKVIVKVDEMPEPDTLEQLQLNYELFESQYVDLEFG